MPLSLGEVLGPYEILAPLGKGGMGEVYRARDTTLKRDVALKVLPAEFLRDPDRASRLRNEAEVLASLNHPGIAHVYGFVEAGDIKGIAMEFVDGATLAGPVPVDTAIDYVQQVIEALEYAHERNVIHRDLKPANIRVTTEGKVKLLDFGLAKAVEDPDPAPPSDPNNSPTVTFGRTPAGRIIGTPAYMAPEQIAGKPADRRSDIFSFGAVLYEMLTGERAFGGTSTEDTLARVLKLEPDWTKLPNETPKVLRDLMVRCLVKDRKLRLQAIGEARIMLLNPASEDRQVERVGPGNFLGRARFIRAWPLAAGVLGLALAALAFVHFRETPPKAKAITASVLPPDSASITGALISPDGSQLVLGVRLGDRAQLWVRPVESLTARPLPGTELGVLPFWSPDSRSIGFFANGQLKRIDLTGGPPLTLADARLGLGGSWNSEGVIVFAPDVRGLVQIPAKGGTPTPVAERHGTGISAGPWFLPDGRRFLFIDLQGLASRDGVLRVGSLDSSEVRTLGPANSLPEYGSGRLVFLRGSTLLAQPFDERRLEVTSETMPVAESVASFSVSRDGLLTYGAGGGTLSSQQLTWFDRKGNALGTVGDPGNFFMIELSPDAKKVAASVEDDVWIYDVARGLRSRFTFAPGIDTNPVWSPDGRSIAFCSNRTGRYGIYRKSSDLTGDEDKLFVDDIDTLTDSWSPDGKLLMVHRRDPTTQEDLAVLPVGGAAGAPSKIGATFIQTPFRELHGKFSPDGRWVAYTSNESQRSEIYVAPFPGPGGKQRISTAGGSQARWRADGKEIYYVAADGALTAAEVAIKNNAIEVGAVQRLNIKVPQGRGWLYDVSHDGQRVLVSLPPEQQSGIRWTLVYNWPLLLKR